MTLYPDNPPPYEFARTSHGDDDALTLAPSDLRFVDIQVKVHADEAQGKPVSPQRTSSSSTSNTSVEFGGMTGGKPRAP